MIWITLEPFMIEFVDALALKHTRARVADGAVPTNGMALDFATRLVYGRNGYRAEAAARCYFGLSVPWSICSAQAGLADFAGFIDAKWIGREHHRLCITPQCVTERAFLLVCGAQHPRYRILGWCWGHEAKVDRYWGDPGTGRPAWWISQDDVILKPPDALRDLALTAAGAGRGRPSPAAGAADSPLGADRTRA